MENQKSGIPRLVGSSWSNPKMILTHEKYSFNDPALSPDEERL